jgi:hypothetical protein
MLARVTGRLLHEPCPRTDAEQAQTLLSGLAEPWDRLMPLALLLARMAVAKDPNNPDYAKVVDAARKATACRSGP